MGTLLIMDTVDIDTQYYLNSHTYSKLISRKKMKKSLPLPPVVYDLGRLRKLFIRFENSSIYHRNQIELKFLINHRWFVICIFFFLSIDFQTETERNLMNRNS